MKLYQRGITFLYYLFIALVAIYSYVLVDPNITFIDHPLWTGFRNVMVQIGYHQRDLSAYLFIAVVALLFIFHQYFLTNYKKVNLLITLLPLLVLGIVSYPFLSHDLFNYMFDAKILTSYHQNPYLHKALDFPQDPWLRFMHWTHRPYPYGPIFLVVSVIPSFLSFGKFLLSFLFFKVTFALFFILAVYYLNKLNKKWAVFFATNPLVIIEGLVNNHNDLIGVSLAVIGIFYLMKKSNIPARILLLLSGGIKYMTLPLIILSRNVGKFNLVALVGLLAIVGYLSFFVEVQPWYFMMFLVFMPFFENWISRLNVFFAGLLFSYYPYIRFGGWAESSHVQMKHNIMIAFAAVNLIYLFYLNFKKESK